MAQTVLQKAVAIAGSQAKLAEAVGVTQQTVSYWVANNQVGAKHVLAVSRLTGLAPHDLNPEVFEAPAEEPERAA
jgi:DNA-binding transcriptional regulator YdaS (Cro superfamily)